jgi:hypothetical protein
VAQRLDRRVLLTVARRQPIIEATNSSNFVVSLPVQRGGFQYLEAAVEESAVPNFSTNCSTPLRRALEEVVLSGAALQGAKP